MTTKSAASAAKKKAAQKITYAATYKADRMPLCVGVVHDADMRDVSWNNVRIAAALSRYNIKLQPHQIVHFINKAGTKSRSIMRHGHGAYSVLCWAVVKKGNAHRMHVNSSKAIREYASTVSIRSALDETVREAEVRTDFYTYRQQLAEAAKKKRGEKP